MNAADRGAPESVLWVGRYRLPRAAPAIARWFLRALWAPRSRRQRWLGRVAEHLPASAALALLARGTSRPGGTPVEPRPGRLLDGAARAAGAAVTALGWYSEPELGRAVEFVFAAGEPSPRWVLKSRPLDAGESLRREHENLRRIRERLSPGLAASLPEPLGFRREEGREWLLLTALPGCTADAELSRWPGDESRRRERLVAVASWLARFHGETASEVTPGREPASPAEGPAGLESLAAALASGEVRRAASHGDFWPRNVLVPEEPDGVVGVVDWETAREHEPPHRDLFDYLVCDAAGRGTGTAVERAEGALRGAFLEPGEGCPTRAYLETYSRLSGLSRTWLEPLFRLWLGELAAGTRELRLVPAPRRLEVARTWLGLYATANRSVFSG